MAELTPTKSVSFSNRCRCCNKELRENDHPVQLFGEKARRENILGIIKRFAEIDLEPNALLSNKVCRSCVTKLKKVNEFRLLCQETKREQQLNMERCKRGSKTEDSPSSMTETERHVQKRSKMTKPTAKSCLKFVNIAPKPMACGDEYGAEMESLLPNLQLALSKEGRDGNGEVETESDFENARARVLPESILPKAKAPSRQAQLHVHVAAGLDILSSSGLQNSKLLEQSSDVLTLAEKEKVFNSLINATPRQLAEAVMAIPKVKECVKFLMLKTMDDQCQVLCSRTLETPSVLRNPRAKDEELLQFTWNNILVEMRDRAPDVLDFLVAISAPHIKGTDGRQVPPICMAYSILMHTRCRELSLVQKINSVLLGAGNATKKTFQRLQKIGISQTRESYHNIMEDVGGQLLVDVRQMIQSGRELRVVFDNFDFKILVNIILRNHSNSDMHWIAQYLTFERVPSDHLNDDHPLVADIDTFENINYLLNREELEKLRNDFTILVMRVLLEFFPCLKPLENAVCHHIPHRFSKEMSQKSTIIGLPIVPFNQNKHSDMCQYLEYLENFLMKVYSPNCDEPAIPTEAAAESDIQHKERILLKNKVPLCGDLLGRERVTGAKMTRVGCDSAIEQFQNIVECVALWHSKQSFLGYIWEQLYKATPLCGREVGTLYHLRQHFRMVNVYSQVKNNYKSAESLMLSATKAYLCSAFMTWAGLESLSGTPSNITIPTVNSSLKEKKEFIKNTFGMFVDEFVLVEFDIEKEWRRQQDQKEGKRSHASSASVQPTTCTSSHLVPDLQQGTGQNHTGNQEIQSSRQAPSSQSATHTTDLLPGQIVILVQTKVPGCGHDVLAVGTIVSMEEQQVIPSHLVQVQVAAVEDIGLKYSLQVGQVIMWPKQQTALYNRPSAPLQQAQPKCSTINETGACPNEETSTSPSLPTPMTDVPPNSEDRLMNYALQCIQLGVMLMQLNDTEKEGDGERSIVNWKFLMLYFRSRSRGMKYAFEAMRLITHVKALYTERMAHRIINGQFVNIRGGAGNNYANDLKMEMLVKHFKVVLKGMCGNKTLKAVERSTTAAYGLKKIIDVFDTQTNIPPESTSHTHSCTKEDVEEMIGMLHEIKPFVHQPGRTLHSFPCISKSPLDQLDVTAMHSWLTRHKRRLAANPFVTNDCNDSSDSDNDDGITNDGDDDDDSDEEAYVLED